MIKQPHPDVCKSLTVLFREGGAGAYQLAYRRVRASNGNLTESEIHQLLRKVQTDESISEFFSNLYASASGLFQKVVDTLKRAASPKSFLDRIERDLPRLQQKAEEVRAQHNTTVVKQDVSELIRRVGEGIPRVPDEMVNQMAASVQEHFDDRRVSLSWWLHKVIVAGILYYYALSFTGGLPFVASFGRSAIEKLSITYFPVIVAGLQDLLYSLGKAEYITP